MRYEDIAALVDDRADEGRFSVRRRIFNDPEVFELEMRHIFGATWVFLGMSSQAAKPHDFFTTWIGRTPVVVMRSGDGVLGAFLNSCRHRGAMVAHTQRGNAKFHVCNYHGWAYDSAGRNIDIKDKKRGSYAPPFDEHNHDLMPLARFGEYRGFLFGGLADDLPPLEAYLGEARKALDLVVDQSPHGVELVPGGSTYTYRGNWKLQIENCSDIYHLTSTHRSFMGIVDRRNSGESRHQLDMMDFGALERSDVARGSFTFPYGHTMTWGMNPTPKVRPLYASIDEVRSRVGDVAARWMLGSRNITIYPSVQLADNAALLMRLIRPLAPDRTEMRLFCVAPVGEAPEVRTYRIRQFEDFFNATGMATPDDNVSYEDCQAGYQARPEAWQQGYERGLSAVQRGADRFAQELGIEPATSVNGRFDLGDETVFHSGYREWLRLMKRGFERDHGDGVRAARQEAP